MSKLSRERKSAIRKVKRMYAGKAKVVKIQAWLNVRIGWRWVYEFRIEAWFVPIVPPENINIELIIEPNK